MSTHTTSKVVDTSVSDPRTDDERRESSSEIHCNDSCETTDEQLFIDDKPVGYVVDEPMEVYSKYRLYTSEDLRRRLHIDSLTDPIQVDVQLKVIDRDVSWDGNYIQEVTFTTELASDGEIYIPQDIVEKLDLSVGDSLRVLLLNVSEFMESVDISTEVSDDD